MEKEKPDKKGFFKNHRERDLLLKLLDNWQKARPEELWGRIAHVAETHLGGPPSADFFIGQVLDACLQCERLADVIRETPDMRAKLWAEEKKAVRDGDYDLAGKLRRGREKLVSDSSRLLKQKEAGRGAF